MSATTQYLIEPGIGTSVQLGGMGAIGKISSIQTNGAFAIVEHPLAPAALAGPLHTHSREDEYSFVLRGEVGFLIGDVEFTAGPGGYVLKPRGIPHTFWNAGPDPATVIEIISPAGFEHYFDELAALLAESPNGRPNMDDLMSLGARYGLTFHLEQLPKLLERHRLRLE